MITCDNFFYVCFNAQPRQIPILYVYIYMQKMANKELNWIELNWKFKKDYSLAITDCATHSAGRLKR